jgi:Rrf2 family protein
MAMYLSQTAEYAFRAMAYLANQPGGVGVRAVDLCEEIAVPLAYLQKILRRLVVAGLLESRKGHGGGFTLARRPEEIGFAEILRAADFEVEEGRCAFGWGDCDPEHPCPLHPSWSRLNECLSGWAENTTLADACVEELPPLKTARRRIRPL